MCSLALCLFMRIGRRSGYKVYHVPFLFPSQMVIFILSTYFCYCVLLKCFRCFLFDHYQFFVVVVSVFIFSSMLFCACCCLCQAYFFFVCCLFFIPIEMLSLTALFMLFCNVSRSSIVRKEFD